MTFEESYRAVKKEIRYNPVAWLWVLRNKDRLRAFYQMGYYMGYESCKKEHYQL